MKIVCSVLFLLVFGKSMFAQDSEEWKDASKESQAYHLYREKITVPPYNLQKVKAILAHAATDSDDNIALSNGKYEALSFREKFTYNMIHGETFSQNCDAMPPIQEEQKKIFAQLPDLFGEYSWSDRQLDFFKLNRDSVIELMRASILRTKRVGLNFKEVIVQLNAKELIPFLVNTYNVEKTDHDLLTVFILLMKQDKYEPFLNSASYKKLYADEESSYRAFLNFNSEIEALIIKRATEFYYASNK